MPGHLNCNTEKRLLAHTLKHLHTKTGGEILLLLSFGFMSPITSFSVCVWMRLCVSAGRCVRVPWQSHFMHHKQTDSVSEWKRWLASRLLRKAFTNRMISSSQLWSSQWPMISIPPHLPSFRLRRSYRDHTAHTSVQILLARYNEGSLRDGVTKFCTILGNQMLISRQLYILAMF